MSSGWKVTGPIPAFILPELCTLLGVHEQQLTDSDPGLRPSIEKLTPSVWYKLRDDKLRDGHREMVGLVRKLGFFLGQLQQVRGGGLNSQYAPVFGNVRNAVDKSAPPSVQGAQAAAAFRSLSGLQQGQTGIGETIRSYFRQIGLLLVESPMKGSSVEGCCFSVNSGAVSTTCIYANSHSTNWFRRNAVLMHELCHAIFDLDDDPVSIDFKDIDFKDSGPDDQPAFSEARAQAFALEALVPKSVLVHLTNKFGIAWNALTPLQLARLVAASHVEVKLLLTAALEAGLISPEHRVAYVAYDCAAQIRELSSHALSTREYLKQRIAESPKILPVWIAENRNTEIGTRKLRLPARYVDEVIAAVNEGSISLGKAAEMTMMERGTFMQRFGNLISPAS